jgi:CBS domain-containing protein
MELRQVMTLSVVTAPAGATAREVAALMREHGVGSVVLVDDDGAPAALVTDRDLALGVLADGRPADVPAAEHASSPVVTGEPSMTIEVAGELMARHGIRRLPVVDGTRLAGIVTLDDITTRTGDVRRAQRLAAQITRAALPGFYFHERGG